jgi:hypothetical protein
MSAPFEPGDVVVCVEDKPCPVYGPVGIRKGAYYRVDAVMHGRDRNTGYVATGCKVSPDDHPMWHNVVRFRKINDEQIPEVLEAILSCKKPGRPALNPSRHYADGRGVQPA